MLVNDQIGDAGRGLAEGDEGAVIHHRLPLGDVLHVRQGQHVQLLGLHQLGGGGGLVDDLHVDLGQGDVVRVPVGLVLLQGHAVFQHAVADVEGPVVHMEGIVIGPVRIGGLGGVNEVLADRVEADHAHLLDEGGVGHIQGAGEGQLVDEFNGYILGAALAVVVRLGALDAGGQKGVGESLLRVNEAHPGVHIVLGGDGDAVGPHALLAQMEGIGQAVFADLIAGAARVLHHIGSVFAGEGAEQPLLDLGEYLELVGVAHIVHVQQLQVDQAQVQHLLGSQLAALGAVVGRLGVSTWCTAVSGGRSAVVPAASGQGNCHEQHQQER